MNIQFKFWYWSVMSFTLIICLLNGIYPLLFDSIELYLFALLMVISGIPHGATDHLIYAFSQKQRGIRISYVEFSATYLLAMMIYGVCWYFFPVWSLAIFLALSAYHFGQSQLLHLSLKEQHPFKITLYSLWGFTVLMSILLFHWSSSQVILSNFIPQQYLSYIDQLPNRNILPWIMMGIVVCLLGVTRVIGVIDKEKFYFEILNLGLLMILFYSSTLLISFAIYFGLWHSLASILTEIRALGARGISLSFKDFIQEAFPLSVVSFIGIAFLLVAAQWLGSLISPYLLFFIAISTLTLPHMYFMNKFYQLGTE